MRCADALCGAQRFATEVAQVRAGKFGHPIWCSLTPIHRIHERSGRKDRNACEALENQKIVVSRDDAVRFRGHGGSENKIVIRVPANRQLQLLGFDELGALPVGAQKRDIPRFDAELAAQRFHKLAKQALLREQFVHRQTPLDDIAAQALCYQRYNRHVGVADDSHETCLKTSSSV